METFTPSFGTTQNRTSGKGCVHIAFAVCSGCGFCAPAHVAGLYHMKAPSHSITAATQDTQLHVPAHQTAISFQASHSSLAVLFPKHWQDHCCALGKQGIPLLLEGATWIEKLLLGWQSIGVPMVPPVPVLGRTSPPERELPHQASQSTSLLLALHKTCPSSLTDKQTLKTPEVHTWKWN